MTRLHGCGVFIEILFGRDPDAGQSSGSRAPRRGLIQPTVQWYISALGQFAYRKTRANLKRLIFSRLALVRDVNEVLVPPQGTSRPRFASAWPYTKSRSEDVGPSHRALGGLAQAWRVEEHRPPASVVVTVRVDVTGELLRLKLSGLNTTARAAWESQSGKACLVGCPASDAPHRDRVGRA